MALKHAPLGEINLPSVTSNAIIAFSDLKVPHRRTPVHLCTLLFKPL